MHTDKLLHLLAGAAIAAALLPLGLIPAMLAVIVAAVGNISSSVSLISILIGTSTATLSQIQVGIDKAPTISASDISVTLV